MECQIWDQFQVRKVVDSTIPSFSNDCERPLESDLKACYKLGSWLDGLETVCKSDDLVVLVPAGHFASLPIHAIPPQGRPLIERNLVVYSSSISLYRECARRVSKISNASSRSLENAIFTAAYEEAGFEVEREEIIAQVKAAAALFGSQRILGSDLTSDTLRRALSSAPWLHYHGHAYFVRNEAVNQCFVLSSAHVSKASSRADGSHEPYGVETPNQADTAPDSGPVVRSREAILSHHLLHNSSQLTVTDIFAMNLSSSNPFICCMACDSGVQDITPSDEPLGLVSALLCAGASSVLGTLWPIQSSTARLFTVSFYNNLLLQQEQNAKSVAENGLSVLNVAVALREAILEIKKKQRDPYSWAPYVLHGAGFYKYQTIRAT